MTGLYIHVPLCLSRCRYCDFYKLTPHELDNIDLFLQCLEIELGRLPKDFAPDTVFIGGGTPTALEPAVYARMLGAIQNNINLSHVVEFTSEANPGTVTPEKLAVMKEGGVNRVSIGVQSFNEKALRLLGRIHSAQGAVDSYHLLREAGFDNVNIDLIQSIPGMSRDDLLDDVRRLIELRPEHASYYNLIYEPNTPMTRDRDAGRIFPPGDDEEADNYFDVKRMLEGEGYSHYEISNFSRDELHCRHNVLYWQGGEYFGCGPSAHSHWQGRRYGNIADLQVYCDRLLRNERPFDEIEVLPGDDKARETLVMWLRMTEGVDLDLFEQTTGYKVDDLCGEAVMNYVSEGLLLRTDDRLSLTDEALFVCNAVFSALL